MQVEEPTRLHSPPPSAAAPKPRGILKNASSSGQMPTTGTLDDSEEHAAGAGSGDADVMHVDAGADAEAASGAARSGSGAGGRLQWDEANLTLHDIERENTAPRMKIDEPKTPFVQGSNLGPDDGMGDDNFALDAASSSSASGSRSSSRRPSAAELTKANTAKNARLGGSDSAAPAVGADEADMARGGSSTSAGEGGLGINVSGGAGADGDAEMSSVAPMSPSGSQSGQSSRSATSSALGRRRSDQSRSPSFNLPDGTVLLQGGRRRSSARSNGAPGTDSAINGLRAEQAGMNGNAGANGSGGALDSDDEDDEHLDPETKAQHEAFAAKRKGHYGNEAEALKVAKLLAQQDDEDDEDDDGEGGLPPPVPAVPSGINGSR